MAQRDIERAATAPMWRRFTDLRRFTIGARDGDIGGVDDLYFDDMTWTVRYLVADTGSWLSGRKVLLSPAALRGVDAASARVATDLTRRQVEESPSVDTQKPVSRQYEAELLSHYGHSPYWGGPYRWGLYAYPDPIVGVPPTYAPAPPAEGRAVSEEIVARERENRDEHLHSASDVTGLGIRATDGELGHVEDFLVDEQDWAIRYLVVDPRSWWPGPHVLVGMDWIRAVSWNDGVVDVDVTREAVRNAPQYEPAGAFPRDEEARLYTHYGRAGYWERESRDARRYPPAA